MLQELKKNGLQTLIPCWCQSSALLTEWACHLLLCPASACDLCCDTVGMQPPPHICCSGTSLTFLIWLRWGPKVISRALLPCKSWGNSALHGLSLAFLIVDWLLCWWNILRFKGLKTTLSSGFACTFIAHHLVVRSLLYGVAVVLAVISSVISI